MCNFIGCIVFVVFPPLHLSTGRIASCIENALPYADVTGVRSVAELEGNLTEDNVLVPIELSMTATINDEVFTIDSFAGCFIRGAGTCTCT